MDVHMLRYDDPLVISPSQTQLWLRCPQLWVLSQRHGLYNDGIKYGRRAAYAIKCYRKYETPFTDDAKLQSIDSAALQASYATAQNYGWPLHTELTLGKARLDEVFQHTLGDEKFPVVLDYKYLLHMSPYSDDSTVCDDYKYSHQLLHYAWCYAQYTGLWSLRDFVMGIAICCFSDTPTITVVQRLWLVDKMRLMQWVHTAIEVWWMMKLAKEDDIWKNADSCYSRQFGQCTMYHRCWSATSHNGEIKNG